MKHNAMIYELLSALDTAIGENKCGTVVVKVVFLITNTPIINFTYLFLII